MDEVAGGHPRGKIEALRALQAPRGELLTSRTAKGAQEEARSLITTWRLRYNLPPTDQRFLDMTDEDVVYDLLVLRYHKEHVEEVLDPAGAEVEKAKARPRKTAQRLEASKAAFLADPANQRALAALGVKFPKPPADPSTPPKPELRRKRSVRKKVAP